MRRKMRGIDSVHAVLSSDDIMCEILLRLPPETVFRLIVVSKRWLHFICSSSFRHNYMSQWHLKFPLLGFFVCNTLYLGRPRNGLRRPRSEPALPFLPTSKEGDDLQDSGILKELGYFIDSSNGLLLCGRHPKTYFVWNPFTKQRYKLPRPRVYFEELCMAFLFEESFDDNMCYKVIRAKCECRLEDIKTVPIETFNPKTSTWNYSTLTCSSPLSLCPWTVGTVIKGVIHWFAEHGNLAIYDPVHGERCISLIKLPDSNDFDEHILGESSNGLLQYGWSNVSVMEIWVLEREEVASRAIYPNDARANIRWNLRYKLSFKTMWKMNPSIVTTFHTRGKETQILSFVPQNSESVFIRSGSDIFLCHLVSKMVEVVPYQGRGSSILWDHSRVIPYFSPAWPRSS
uniref:Uncharacterized protein n=1 Tax=Rhizophora mucronata TaxID=61149 RepID=A0A2P2IT67_RHIMU